MFEYETYAACYKLLNEMFKTQPGETVCITYDTESSEELAEATAAAAVTLGAKPLSIKISAPRAMHKAADIDLPWDSMFGAITGSDIWIEYNAKIICNSRLFDEVFKANKELRYINLVGAGPSMIVRLIGRTDLKVLAEFNRKVTEATKNAKVIRITSLGGTDISFSNVPGRIISCEDGEIPKGKIAMMPGQIYWTPDHDTMNGTIVLEDFIHNFPQIDAPVVCKIEKGYITEITGGKTAKAWSAWMHSFNDPGMFRIAHATYGVHPNAVLGENGDIVENERIWGTTLWGFGSISDFLVADVPGGMHAAEHTDALCPSSSVYLDGVPFFENGEVVGPTDEIVQLARQLKK